MTLDTVLKIIDTILQIILVVFAGMALSAWKKETRGKDKYKLAKDLLTYIRELRFLVYSIGGSMHQIYINDILVGKKNFYEDQLLLIKDEKVCFDQSVWGLFGHINTRSDLLLPKQVRVILEELCPRSGKKVGLKNQFTYINLAGVKIPPMTSTDEKENLENVVYTMHDLEGLTIEQYFRKWEKLIIELQKLI